MGVGIVLRWRAGRVRGRGERLSARRGKLLVRRLWIILGYVVSPVCEEYFTNFA